VVRIDASGAITNVVEGGLPSADVTALAPAFGSLWIGTFDHGLARRDRDGSVHEVTEATSRWHVDARINDLARTLDDAHGERLWIATDRGLFVHDGRSFVPVVDRDGPGDRHVSALHVDDAGTLWAAGSEGLFSLRAAAQSWSQLPIDDPYGMRPLGAVTTDARGTVWAGGLHGLFEIDAHSGHVVRHAVSTSELPVDWVTSVARTASGIVAGTYHGGIVWVADAGVTIEREARGALPTGWVNPHALAVIDGVVWFGSLDRGLVVGARSRWRAFTLANGLPGNDVTAISPNDDGSVWIGTRAGLVRVERH
jgi:ligand-binding sensor domain-containing protein